MDQKPLRPEQLAAARALIVKAKTHLVLDYPFFAAMLLQKPLKEFDATFAVDKRGQIYWSPRWVVEQKLTLQQIIFALCHEVMHVVGMDFIRMGGRQPRPWNIAGDAFINDTLKSCNIGEFIDGCVDMPGSKDKTKEEIYAAFPPPDPNGGGGQGQGDGTPEYGDGAGDYGIGDDFFDDGSGPLSEAEAHQIEAETKVAVSQAAQAARMQGKLPAAIDRLVEEILTVKTPWFEKLNRFMRSAAKSEYSWRKPNKRFAHLGMYLPSQDSQCAMGTMVFAVDTSGSIGDKELQYAAGHLNAILETCKPEKLVVIYCDAAVNKVVEFTHDELPCRLEAVGGGGTSFVPVFDHVAEQLTETPACLVYFTDMLGTFPTDPPPYPVLWLNIAQPAEPPFGEEVMFDMDEEN